MKNAVKLQVLGVLILLGAGLWIAGCKSAPDLTQAQALTMIQAKYDQTPAEPVSITVNTTGMLQGVTAKYWFSLIRTDSPKRMSTREPVCRNVAGTFLLFSVASTAPA